MQPNYRNFLPQPPQRSPHAATARRGIGPMISGAHPQSTLTPAQMQAQQAAQLQASDRAKMRSRKPTDKNIPEGIEDLIIGDGVQRYRDLRDIERRLDATMSRKRLDIQDSVNRSIKRQRVLRVWISNTVEDQPWQADALDADAFDFGGGDQGYFRVKIEGKVLDEDEDELNVDSDESDVEEGKDVSNGDRMDEDVRSKHKKKRLVDKSQYNFSHFFKSMTVDFDRTKIKEDMSVEWKKPSTGPTAANLPNAADFDQLEFKRRGDETMNITINLVRDETPEVFSFAPPLVDILDMTEGTRDEAQAGLLEYIQLMKLQEEDEKRAFTCNEPLKALLQREKGYLPYLADYLNQHTTALPPVRLQYTIRCDKDFHDNPTPTIYDIAVQVDDPLRVARATYINDQSYAQSLREIVSLNDHLSLLIQKISNSKSKHTFFDALSKNPTEFIAKWLSSQKRDLEIIAGEAIRGGGEDATGDEWRRGGKDGVWGSENVKESVNLLVGRPKA